MDNILKSQREEIAEKIIEYEIIRVEIGKEASLYKKVNDELYYDFQEVMHDYMELTLDLLGVEEAREKKRDELFEIIIDCKREKIKPFVNESINIEWQTDLVNKLNVAIRDGEDLAKVYEEFAEIIAKQFIEEENNDN